jgi:hypothetical protein
MQPTMALAPAAPAPDPAYIIENRKRLLALDCREALRYVRVLSGVASITNGLVLLRAPLDIPNGLYTYTDSNQLRPERAGWMSYPDIEVMAPPFARMQPYCEILNTPEMPTLGSMIPWVERARELNGTIVFAKDGAYFQQHPDFCFNFPFNVRDEIVVSAHYLRLVLGEMLRYDRIYLSREENRFDKITPLVFGKSWAECALLMPQDSAGYGLGTRW